MSLLSALGRPARVSLMAVLLVGLALPLTIAPVSAAGLVGGGDQSSQDSRDTAQLTLRIQNLEQQVRDLTGQVQGLQFQLTQVQALIDRMNQDNDFRFKALEGGKGGAPAAGGSIGRCDAAGSRRSTRPAPTLGSAPAALAAAGAQTDTASADTSNASGDDGLGGSMDPLVGKGRPGVTPGADEVPLAPSTGQPVTANPADRQQPAGAAPTQEASIAPAAQNPAAAAQYKSGYDAIVKGNYTAAADQFKAFIKQYPTDPQVPDATNWLGEALLQQQDYVDAAEVLVTGYKSYPTSPRAPDMLLKLGIALAGTQHVDAACKTFGLLASKYPNTTTAFRTRLKQEMARDQCPA